MNTKTNPQVTDDRMVFITRIFDAPRELVFKAWTDPDQLVRWFAPKDCTIHFSRIDIRPGGGFHSCISNPNFGDCWCRGVYHEIVAPERLIFTMGIADKQGNLVEPSTVGHDPAWPRETTLTVTFENYADKTKLTLHQTVSELLAKRTGAYPSWLQMLDRLAENLSLKAN